MNPNHFLPRREFLASSGVLTVAALTGALSGLESAAADAGRHAAAEAVLKEMEGRGAKFLSVPTKDGEFLRLLTRVARAKKVLEIGTSQGYSALWISLGLEETGGHLTTVEIVPERSREARGNLAKAGLAHRVTFLEGDAHEVVTTLEGPFDFVFLDADKDGQVDYFNKLFPKKIAPGALLVCHNAIRYGDSMKDYFELVRKHPEFETVVLSLTMEDGFAVSYRRRA